MRICVRSIAARARELEALASRLPTYRSEGRGFEVTASLDDAEATRVLATIADHAWNWKETRMYLDGEAVDPLRTMAVLACWVRKVSAKASEQRRHCIKHTAYVARAHPEEFDHPCCAFARDDKTPRPRWAEFAKPETDHDGLIGAVEARATAFQYRWCPGYNLEPVLHRIRRLPPGGADFLIRKATKVARTRLEVLTVLGHIKEPEALREEMERLAAAEFGTRSDADAARLSEILPEFSYWIGVARAAARRRETLSVESSDGAIRSAVDGSPPVTSPQQGAVTRGDAAGPAGADEDHQG